MALKAIETDDGDVYEVNAYDQSYKLLVRDKDNNWHREEFVDWEPAAAAYQAARAKMAPEGSDDEHEAEVTYMEMLVFKTEFMLQGEDFKELDEW